MKDNKPAAPQGERAVGGQESQMAQEPLSALDKGKIGAFSLLLFAAMTIQTGRMSMILLAVALLCSVGKLPLRHMGQRLSVPVAGFLALALMTGLAAIYSSFDTYAVGEFYKFLAAFSVVLILLARFEKKHVKGLLWGFAAISGAIGLLCVDAAASARVFGAFNTLAEALGATFSDLVQTPHRVNGLYNDANVSAALLALGAVAGLYLAAAERQVWKRLAACLLLGMSAQAFFLSLSRGAILCFGLSLLVWLAAAPGRDRLRLFLLMFLAAGVTVALSIPAMAALDGTSALPTLLTAGMGLGVFALDMAVGAPLSGVLRGKGKAVAAVVAALLAAGAGYLWAALNTHGPYALPEGEMLVRTVELPAGEYTLSGDWDGQPDALVYSQTEMDRARNTSTRLYSGPLDEAVFTVPGGEPVVTTIRLSYTQGGGTIRALSVSDGTQVPLDYPLLPAFVAVRLQDNLLASASFTLRVQFMKDALTLFLRSPLLGHGLGSTEGLYTAVQPYYYESLYAHSHVLQVMCDMGLLGLAGFLALLGGVLWLLLRAVRGRRDPMAAMLLACWVMMNSHSLMEINFSIRAFQCAAFTLLMLAMLLYAKPLSRRAARLGGWLLAGGFWAYGLVFGGLTMSHRVVERQAAALEVQDAYTFMTETRGFVTRDVFVREQNMLNFVGNAVLLDSAQFNATMERYVQALRNRGTYTACSGLARYYYLPRGEFAELFACSRQGIAQEASNRDSWNLQLDFYRNEVLPAAGAEHMEEFLDGVLALGDYLEAYSQGRQEEIQLSGENQSFLSAAASVRENGMSGQEAYMALMLLQSQEETAS